ncbi:hypothetical protein B1B00_03615 [Bacillus sp. DSM 27956]|nr:hypothetical protein B1B00_03615 [Bacillus sp. DSM 27956]
MPDFLFFDTFFDFFLVLKPVSYIILKQKVRNHIHMIGVTHGMRRDNLLLKCSYYMDTFFHVHLCVIPADME